MSSKSEAIDSNRAIVEEIARGVVGEGEGDPTLEWTVDAQAGNQVMLVHVRSGVIKIPLTAEEISKAGERREDIAGVVREAIRQTLTGS